MYTDNIKFWHEIRGFSDKLDDYYILTKNIKTIQEEELKIFGSTLSEDAFNVNSYNYRCDEFIKKHNRKHILFSGCSYTFGTGLTKEETWANQVYKKFDDKYGCSGYFNLGLKGNNIYSSILNIFKYCKNFGNPEAIFINLPESKRFFDFDKKESKYKITYYNKVDDSFYINKLITYNTYLMLEQYCNSNNIKLFSFTYDCLDKDGFECTNELFKKFNFKTFYYINQEKMVEDLFLLKQTKNNKYFDLARDKRHRGTGWNLLWSDFIWKKYLESI
jgi:hypothetical protein